MPRGWEDWMLCCRPSRCRPESRSRRCRLARGARAMPPCSRCRCWRQGIPSFVSASGSTRPPWPAAWRRTRLKRACRPRRREDSDMPVTAIVGGHWGDEGKGKVVDALAAHADQVIRFNGGNNAGHTIVGDHGELRLHLVPSGILHSGVECIIGPGVVVDPRALFEELTMLESAGISTARLRVSDRAHLVFPFHVELDEIAEVARGAKAHGTTRRGIWPVYADKAARTGIRAGDLLEPAFLQDRLHEVAQRATALLGRTVTMGELWHQCEEWSDRLIPYIVDTHPLVQAAPRRHRPVGRASWRHARPGLGRLPLRDLLDVYARRCVRRSGDSPAAH